MQWMSLGLVVLLGGASLFAHDPRFIMLKPTFIYAVVGAVMLKPGWMTRYMTPLVLQWSRDVIVAFGYVWAVMMFATGALNVALVFHGDPKVWAWFIGVFPIASKLSLFVVQYLVTRLITIAWIIRAPSSPAGEGPPHRRDLLKALRRSYLDGGVAPLAAAARGNASRVRPSDPAWPSAVRWDELKRRVGETWSSPSRWPPTCRDRAR